MARIRTIKPEFPQSETVGKLSRDARLLFLMLFTIVDDEGRSRAASRMLASLLYPYDDDARDLIEGWLAELERHDSIHRYTVDGNQYLVITNWLTHQKIDHPTKSRLPPPPGNSPDLANPREDSRGLAPDLGPRTMDQGEDRVSAAVAAAPAAHAEGEAGGQEGIDERVLSLVLVPKLFEEFWALYPKRAGANPKNPALKKFKAAVLRGVVPETLVASARTYAAEMQRLGKVGTEFVAQAETWLDEERWGDYAPSPDDAARAAAVEEDMKRRGYQWIGGKWTFVGKSKVKAG